MSVTAEERRMIEFLQAEAPESAGAMLEYVLERIGDGTNATGDPNTTHPDTKRIDFLVKYTADLKESCGLWSVSSCGLGDVHTGRNPRAAIDSAMAELDEMETDD